MDPSKHIEVALFEAASSLAPHERDAFLNQTCQGDPALRDRLERLLNLSAASESFFETPLPTNRPDGTFPLAVIEGDEEGGSSRPSSIESRGTCIGRYRLISRIGEGGCGVVYLAEQLEPIRRQVALKIIRLGMDTETVIARFDLERKALAMMDHPNIARVLDAGATSTGRPFFVMELVNGEKLTDFCNEKHLPLRERLALFIQVCNAIQHAHQKGIIHRDIKPSNVLVGEFDGEPVPKAIDFGIAKATMTEGLDHTLFTITDQLLGTPAYMSPEQAMGGSDVDTRSDIYSLGVLLYELICGHPPFDPHRLKEANPFEARRIVCEEEPVPPSRATGAKDLVELDWIALKAMSKERQLRYETANGLATDVRRFLNDEPVLACPPKRVYRLKKLIYRNKLAFMAGGVSVFALLAGFGVATRFYFVEKKAKEEQSELRRLAEEARNNEAKLKEAAEAQGLLSKAAVLIQYGNLQGADHLLEQVPASLTPSSLEAGEVYQKVADWHLLAGRWEEAARRYSSLVRAISRVDDSDNDTVSRNLLYASAAICYTGDDDAYGRIRNFAIERFSTTTHPVVAEQVLKVCLLRPANEPLLKRLRPLAAVLSQALETKDSVVARNPHLAAWSCFSMALMSYRDGDDKSAGMWANRCLAFKRRNPAREASANIILAMVEHRAGHAEKAEAILNSATGPVIQNSDETLKYGDDDKGSWHAWVTARILLREAARMIRN
jgi:serine/threonine protein kinase